MSKRQKQDCPGAYEVSGYTTDSGKKVDSYIRRCWKHGEGGNINIVSDKEGNLSEGTIYEKSNSGEKLSGSGFVSESDDFDNVIINLNEGENPFPSRIFEKANPPEDLPVPQKEEGNNWGEIALGALLSLGTAAGSAYLSYLMNRKEGKTNLSSVNLPKVSGGDNFTQATYKNFELSKFDPKKTETDIKNSTRNIENILKQKIVTKEDIAKISNQTQIVMHNLFDDIEDLSVQKSNLPKILTVKSSEKSQKIENDRKQIRENAYQTILMLYQQRNVVEKQWKKVSTKDDDYDNKFNQYIKNKQEIEKLSDTAKDLFDYASKIDDTTLKKVKKLREDLGLMRFRPILPKKQVEQQQKWIWPCHGKIVGEYGELRATHTHNGIDIAVPVGTPAKAIADGTVVAARSADGYGKFVVIEHSLNGQIITSEYGHISRWIVSKNQIVKQGQIIAYSGNEGYSFGPHVHLTIRIGKYQGKAVNPWDYINH